MQNMKKEFLLVPLLFFFASWSQNNGTYDNRSGPNSNSDYQDQPSRSYEAQDADRQITDRVKTTLMNDSNLSTASRFIDVETYNCVVTLTGDVSSKEISNAIERKVKTIKGVRKVNNQLTIKP